MSKKDCEGNKWLMIRGKKNRGRIVKGKGWNDKERMRMKGKKNEGKILIEKGWK